MSSKEKILHVAAEQFYLKGYQCSSVDDIIADAGVSKSNFYYHFKSKEDLGLTVLNYRSGEFRCALDRTLCNQENNPEQRLLSFLKMMQSSQEESLNQVGCPFGNLVAEMAEHSEKIRCSLSRMFGSLKNLVSDVISEGQEAGVFRDDVGADNMAALIITSLQGMLLMTKCHKSLDTLGQGVTTLVRLIKSE